MQPTLVVPHTPYPANHGVAFDRNAPKYYMCGLHVHRGAKIIAFVDIMWYLAGFLALIVCGTASYVSFAGLVAFVLDALLVVSTAFGLYLAAKYFRPNLIWPYLLSKVIQIIISILWCILAISALFLGAKVIRPIFREGQYRVENKNTATENVTSYQESSSTRISSMNNNVSYSQNDQSYFDHYWKYHYSGRTWVLVNAVAVVISLCAVALNVVFFVMAAKCLSYLKEYRRFKSNPNSVYYRSTSVHAAPNTVLPLNELDLTDPGVDSGCSNYGHSNEYNQHYVPDSPPPAYRDVMLNSSLNKRVPDSWRQENFDET